MNKTFLLISLLVFICSIALAQDKKGLKVFISVDMEGLTGVVNWEEVSRDGKDYDYFRNIMAKETNAAIMGALEAGVTEIIVRDSHGSARNILPDMLIKHAKLLRDWSGSHKSMMEGIDKTFDAVVFIGYHAKAGTPDATLEHTMSGSIMDVSINGISLPEAGINALIAGYYNVPVVFLSGDLAICKQATELFGELETVAVKEGIGKAALNLHPDVAYEKIKKGVKTALSNLTKYKPYKLKPPYKMLLTLKKEELVNEKSFYPGAERTGDWELTYKSNDIMEIMKAFRWMH
ncbi:M55 family metallopeptidase [candidate division KSB1 bacterium]|nr:M55 family metallopeptidase [candidate division KSB1 bacterium]